jgi:uncharacterized membrane protein
VAKPDPIFVYLGTYTTQEVARADYNALKDPLSTIVLRTFDVALVTKDASGTVHVNKDDVMKRHGTWGGAVAGAMVGILCPPAIIATAAVGGAAGAISGHLWRGVSRSDVKELGELIDAGEAALLLIGGTTLEAAIDELQLKADNHVAKQLDVDTCDIDSAIKDAERKINEHTV